MTQTAADAAVLAARAAELARPVDQQQSQTRELLLLTVSGQQVAVAVDAVREVRPPGPVGQLPGSSGALAGLVGGHGDALAVAELATLLRLPTSVAPDHQWVAVLDHRTSPLGLLVDSALDVVTVDPADLRAPLEAGGLVSALLPDGAVVLDTVALLRDHRMSLAPPDPTEELS